MKEEEQALLRQQEIEIMSKLKEAIKNGKKMERTSQPAIVMENKEPPDIPELKMGEMVDSPFTGDNAMRYLARLPLGSRKGEGADEEVKGQVEDEVKGEEGLDTEDGESGVKSEEIGREEAPMKETGENGKLDRGGKSDSNSILSKAMGEELTKRAKSSKKKKRSARKQRQMSKKSKTQSDPDFDKWEEQRLKLYQEIERDTREALIVAAEAINRNQTPVVQESKVYSMPGRRGKSKAPPILKNTPPMTADKSTTAASDDPNVPTDRTQSEDTPTNTEATPTDTEALDDKATPTNDETPPADIDGPPTTNKESSPEPTSTEGKASESSDSEATPTDATTTESPPTSNDTRDSDEQDYPVNRARPPKHRKTREEIREEEIRKRFPGMRAWPTQEECDEKPLPKTVVFTSTWLSVTAKGVK